MLTLFKKKVVKSGWHFVDTSSCSIYIALTSNDSGATLKLCKDMNTTAPLLNYDLERFARLRRDNLDFRNLALVQCHTSIIELCQIFTATSFLSLKKSRLGYRNQNVL